MRQEDLMETNNKQDAKLSQNMHTLIKQNAYELSKVQGNILSAAENKEIKTIFVTSCYASEGKTVTAISMAYGLCANAKARVLLIDAHFDSPSLHKLFNLISSPGLSDLILYNAKYNEVIRKSEYYKLMLMSHGTEISNPLQIFNTSVFKDKLNFLKQNFDYIIFDGSSVFGSTDASVMASYFDGIVIVIECENTRWEVLHEAQEKVVKVGGNILGAVLNQRRYYIPKVLYGKI